MAAFQTVSVRPAAPVLSMRPRSTPVPAFKASSRRVARFQVLAAADPTETKTPVESAIESAKKTCDDGTTQECAAAWDEVEELAANASHRKELKGAKVGPIQPHAKLTGGTFKFNCSIPPLPLPNFTTRTPSLEHQPWIIFNLHCCNF